MDPKLPVGDIITLSKQVIAFLPRHSFVLSQRKFVSILAKNHREFRDSWTLSHSFTFAFFLESPFATMRSSLTTLAEFLEGNDNLYILERTRRRTQLWINDVVVLDDQFLHSIDLSTQMIMLGGIFVPVKRPPGGTDSHSHAYTILMSEDVAMTCFSWRLTRAIKGADD